MALGDIIKSKREKYGYSMEELASQIGVSKQSISKYERGLSEPSAKVLIAIAGRLGIEVETLFNPVGGSDFTLEDVNLISFDYREGERVEQKDKLETELASNVVASAARLIELEQIASEEIKFVNPLDDLRISDQEDVEHAVNKLRRSWKLGSLPIHSVITLLENHGVVVLMESFQDDFEGASGWCQEHPVIVVNSNKIPSRLRFTALHELAHVLLRFDEQLTLKEVEMLCNHFAGAMLLPKDALKHLSMKNRANISLSELVLVKQQYGISVMALILRFSLAGYIDFQTYVKWRDLYQSWYNDRLEDKGYDFGEYPIDETPTRFRRLLVKCLNEERITHSKAASLSGMNIEQVRAEFQKDLKFNRN